MFVPLANFTHYSLQYGFSKPKELIAKCEECGYTVCGITDMKTISGCVEFFKLCKEKGIKPILGMALDKDTFLFAKNKDGWKELIKIHSNVETSTDNLICVSDTRKDFKDFRLNDGSIKAYYYCDSSDQDVHQISVCSGLKITRKDPKPESYKHIFTQDLCLPEFGYESDLINGIINDCEEYNILKSPQLPHFPTSGKTEEEFLKDICREGWTKKITPILKSTAQKDEYLRRFQHEFSVIKEANLFGYFLIVYDIIKYANSKGFLTGVGRGSAAGCLISYLMDITKLDPIKYNLLFERFYSEARNTEGNVSLPDIDLDVPSCKRDEIIDYVVNKYGKDNVAQISTFSRLQGRSVLKEVLRVNESCGFSEMNAMTKHIPDEAAISDELKKMDEDERSIIRWALIHKKSELEPFCAINEDKLTGDYAEQFAQAIKLEGTYKNMGTHAAGIVISQEALINICPIIDGIAQMEMGPLEDLSLVKLDILGVSVLSKLMRIEELAKD